jgi:hypothetical protein
MLATLPGCSPSADVMALSRHGGQKHPAFSPAGSAMTGGISIHQHPPSGVQFISAAHNAQCFVVIADAWPTLSSSIQDYALRFLLGHKRTTRTQRTLGQQIVPTAAAGCFFVLHRYGCCDTSGSSKRFLSSGVLGKNCNSCSCHQRFDT